MMIRLFQTHINIFQGGVIIINSLIAIRDLVVNIYAVLFDLVVFQFIKKKLQISLAFFA